MEQTAGKSELAQGYKYLREAVKIFEKLHGVRDHHNRNLHYDEYILMLLFKFFNPAISSIRSLQNVLETGSLQERLGVKRASLGSLSEASRIFDAKLLEPVMEELAKKVLPQEADERLKHIEEMIVAFDGTLIRALPKMMWALWLNDQNRSAKLHLEYDIRRQVPSFRQLTDANKNERSILRGALTSGKLYLLDSGYAEYKLLQDIITANSSFVCRLQDNAAWEVKEERAISEEQRASGIQRDLVVRLGSVKKKDALNSEVRVIEVFHKGDSTRPRKSHVSSKKFFRTTACDYTFLLVSDRLDLSADDIVLLYRYRWQIELFFRWFKCVLKCRHLLAHSPNGVALQIYCALIASMLISIWTGRKPTKRTFEMLSLYMAGWIKDYELIAHINKLKFHEGMT